MQILIMRHGQADLKAQPDAARPLTPQGELEIKLMAAWMKKMQYQPDAIWVSPYKRAQQTCQQVIDVMDLNIAAKTQSFITPSGLANEVHDIIDGELAVNPAKQLLIVSHMPLVSYLVSELTNHQQAPIFQTAGVTEIEYLPERMSGEFVRMVSPLDLC